MDGGSSFINSITGLTSDIVTVSGPKSVDIISISTGTQGPPGYSNPTLIDHNLLADLDIGDPHPQYVNINIPRTITAVDTYAPITNGPPFILGATAANQLVTGFNADLLDGYHAGSFLRNTQVGIPNGLVQLDSNGYIPAKYFSSNLINPSSLKYLGEWDASLNIPQLSSSVGPSAGSYYIVGKDGATTLDGNSNWSKGDWVLFSNTGVWQQIAGTSSKIKTIFGRSNTNIIAMSGDYSGDLITFTSSSNIPTQYNNVSSAIDYLNSNKASLNGAIFTATPYSPNAPLNDNSNLLATTSWIHNQNYISSNSGLNFTGDVTGTLINGTVKLLLNQVNSNPGTFGSTNLIPVITVGKNGLVTQITNQPLVITWSNISSVPTTLSGLNITDKLNTVNSIIGGGNLNSNLSIQLVGDQSTLGANYYYGTGSVPGQRGWYLFTPAMVNLGNVQNALQVINSGNFNSISSGILLDMPQAGFSYRFYFQTDTLGLYYDDGQKWNLMFPALTGDVSKPIGSNITQINNNAVTFNKIQILSPLKLLGNSTNFVQNVEEIGLGNTLIFNNGILNTVALSGDITSSGINTTISQNVVDNNKLAQMNAITLKGNNTLSTGNAKDLTAQDVVNMIQEIMLNNAHLTGISTSITPPFNDTSTRIATTEWVMEMITARLLDIISGSM